MADLALAAEVQHRRVDGVGMGRASPPSIWNVLALVEQRPAMFLGHESDRGRQLDALEGVVVGWFLAVRHHRVAEPDIARWSQFTEYVAGQLGRSTIRDPISAVREASRDEEHAWNLLWGLVASFRSGAGTSG